MSDIDARAEKKREEKVAKLKLPERVRFLSLDEIQKMPRPRPLISGVLYSDMEHVLFGPQGTAKTFLAIDWAMHMAYQQPWMGIPVQHAKTVYVCGEGGGVMFADRINAWLEYHEISDATAVNELLRITSAPVPLMDEAWVDRLIEEIQREAKVHMIIVDTLAANFGPGDENSNADMGVFCQAMRRLRLATGAGIMVIHHTGHADKTRPQGGNMLRRNVDIELRVDRDSSDSDLFGVMGGGELKARHGKGCGLLPFKLESVELPASDSLGQPISSAVVVPTQDTPTFQGQTAATTRLGKNQKKGRDILRMLAEKSGQDLDDPDGVHIASADWKEACEASGLTRSQRFQIRAAFLKRGWIRETAEGGFKWFPG